MTPLTEEMTMPVLPASAASNFASAPEPPPHELRELIPPKQFCQVDRATSNVTGWFLQVTAPEDTETRFYVEISPPFSSAGMPRTTPTQTLRYRGGSAVVWEEDGSIEQLGLAAIDAIDAAGEALRLAVISKMTQTPEYVRAEQHAREYRAAGYPEGDDAYVPPGVASWAMAKWRAGWTARQAADDILATAHRWYALLDEIRALRLANKEDVRHATTAGEVAAIVADMESDMHALALQMNTTTTE